MWLDANPDIVSVAYEKLYIPYLSNVKTGKMRRYYPDFVIEWADGRKEIIEVKPFAKLTSPSVVKKGMAAVKYAVQNGMVYKYQTEKDLKPLGLLKRKPTIRKSSRKLMR